MCGSPHASNGRHSPTSVTGKHFVVSNHELLREPMAVRSSLEAWRCDGRGLKFYKMAGRVKYKISDFDA